MLKTKIVKAVALALSATTLCGALVYYNFIHKAELPDLKTGDVCPDFTVKTYTKVDGDLKANNDTFTLFENRGKVIVINFWYVTCGGCREEMPHFDELQKKYPDDVIVLALDGEQDYTYQNLTNWFNVQSVETGYRWADFSFTFGRYEVSENNLYKTLGFSGAWPSTLIVDRNGIIREKVEISLEYSPLEELVLPLINDTENA